MNWGVSGCVLGEGHRELGGVSQGRSRRSHVCVCVQQQPGDARRALPVCPRCPTVFPCVPGVPGVPGTCMARICSRSSPCTALSTAACTRPCAASAMARSLGPPRTALEPAWNPPQNRPKAAPKPA